MYGFFGGSAILSFSWQQLKVGAGGLLSSLSVANDGTFVLSTDTYGAYIFNSSATTPQGNAGGTGAWQQLASSTKMPADFVASSFLYNYGCYAISNAPSDSNTIYMAYPVVIPGATFPGSIGIYKSTDKGNSFLKTAFTPVSRANNDANATHRYWGPRIAVHPTDPLTCYFATGDSGLFKTTDGGTTWSHLINLPTALSVDPGITGLVIQPGTPATLFASSSGNGIYKSTDSGANWTRINSGVGPVDAVQAAISSNGTFYAIAGDFTLWTYIATTWTQVVTAGNGNVRGVSVDPNNAARAICATYNGLLNETTNNGGAWSGWAASATTAASDIPWQHDAFTATDTQGLHFDPTVSNKLIINGDQNIWTTTLSGAVTTGTALTWNSMGVGIEQIVTDEIICPRANKPILGGWDWDTFAIQDLTKYPLTHGTTGNVWNGLLSAAWSVDYASTNLDFIVKNADEVFLGGRQASGFSSNGGVSWTNFPTLPPNTTPAGTGNAGGNIAAASTTNFIFASANGVQPYFTTDAAATWTAITLPGTPSWSTFLGPYYTKTRAIAADRVAADTFYLLLEGSGVYRSTDKGVTWTLQSSAVSGYGRDGKLLSTPSYSGVSAGDLWLASGPGDFTAGAAPNGLALQFSTDAGVTWTPTSIFECLGVGFCVPKPGNTYPSVAAVGYLKTTSATSTQAIGLGVATFTIGTGLTYPTPGVAIMLCDHSNSVNRVVGTVTSYDPVTGVLAMNILTTNGSGTPASWDVYTMGIWRSDDHGSTWTMIGVNPCGNMDYICTIAGDPGIYNKWYVGFKGSGYAFYG